MRGQSSLLIVFLLLPIAVRSDSRPQGPMALLARGRPIAMLYNWPKAAPLYAQAESLFVQSGDQKNALVRPGSGYLWSTADVSVSPAINREVAAYLENSIAQSDSALKLRALVAKAVLDRSTNEIAARGPWEQVLEIATRLGDNVGKAARKLKSVKSYTWMGMLLLRPRCSDRR